MDFNNGTGTNEEINNTNPNNEPEQNGEPEVNTTSFTDEQMKIINAMIQKTSDVRVTQALKTQQKKYEKQISLSKLDDNAREKAEKDNEIADLKEQLAQFTIERNRSELKSVLSSRGLSAEFADIINITDDIEASQEKIDKLDKLFKAAVTAEVTRRLAGNAPRGNSGAQTEITKEDAKKMSLAELNDLMVNKPDLFNKFFN